MLLLFQTPYSIPGLRFRPPRNVYAESEENPENACYCRPDREFCPPSGIFKASPCVFGKSECVRWSVDEKLQQCVHNQQDTQLL
jgi:CD36 family.